MVWLNTSVVLIGELPLWQIRRQNHEDKQHVFDKPVLVHAGTRSAEHLIGSFVPSSTPSMSTLGCNETKSLFV